MTADFLVVKSHRNEFPNPIQLKIGDHIHVGERYEGPEPWSGWYLCTVNGQEPGWVPEQVFELLSNSNGIVLSDYTAQELDVDEGEFVRGAHSLNGWVWCSHSKTNKQGWVPGENLRLET